MASPLTLVLLLTGVGICTAQVLGGFSVRSDHHTNPKFLELAHFATETSSRQQGKPNFDTVDELTKVETQVVAGTNYRLTLRVAESVCPLTSQYSKEACPPKPEAARRACTTVVTENLQGVKSLSSFECV